MFWNNSLWTPWLKYHTLKSKRDLTTSALSPFKTDRENNYWVYYNLRYKNDKCTAGWRLYLGASGDGNNRTARPVPGKKMCRPGREDREMEVLLFNIGTYWAFPYTGDEWKGKNWFKMLFKLPQQLQRSLARGCWIQWTSKNLNNIPYSL